MDSHGWDLSDSDEEAAEEQSAPAERRRGPGRPRGFSVPAATREFRDQQLVAAGVALPVGCTPPREADGTRDERRLVTARAPAFVQYLNAAVAAGPVVYQLIARNNMRDERKCSDDAVTALVEHYDGGAFLSALISHQSASLGRSARTLKRQKHELAAATYFASRAFAFGVLSQVNLRILQEQLEPVACIQYTLWDETPLQMRSKTLQVGEHHCNPELLSYSPDAVQSSGGDLSRGVCKVVQTETELALVVRDKLSGVYTLLRVPLVCPLLIVDRTTGETILACQVEQTYVHSLDALVEKFPMRIDATTSDRAASNLKCEEGLYRRHPDRLRLNLPCAIHCCATAQGRAYAPVDTDISGIIAMALAMKPGGAVGQFRAAIRLVLESSVEFHDRPPLRPDDAKSLYREAVLDATIGSAIPGDISRRTALGQLLNGDWRSDAVDVCWSGRAPNKTKWAELAAECLLPHPLEVFPRNRWLQSISSVKQVMLLANVHNVLARSVPVWMTMLKGEASEHTTRLCIAARSWDLSDDEGAAVGSTPRRPREGEEERGHQQGGSEGALVVHDPQTEMAQREQAGCSNWTEWNTAQRGSTEKFVASDPRDRLVVATLTIPVCQKIMWSMEDIAGGAWEHRKMMEEARGSPGTSRILQALSGRLQWEMQDRVDFVLGTDEPWGALHPTGRTWGMAGLAFSMVSIAECAMEQLTFRFWRTFPWLLFRMTCSDAGEEMAAVILKNPAVLARDL